jgi:hypothetical protein
MKSNKQRYNESLNSNNNGSNGNGSNPLMWIVIFVALFALIYSTRALWCDTIGLCHDDLSVGTYNPFDNGTGEQR